jgi:Low-density lipoprotein receptor domain class A
MRSLVLGALTLVLAACGTSGSSGGGGGSGGGGNSLGGSATSGGATSGGTGGAGSLGGTGSKWSSLPAGHGERAKARTAACEAQCKTDGGCGFWDADACVRHCADPRLACQADLAADACWQKMGAFSTCQAGLSCAELNQFYYHAEEAGRPCKAAADELEAACGFLELVASEQCYGPSSTCSDGSALSPYWVCDGDNDCKDGADEADCPWLKSSTTSTCAPSTYIDGTDSAGDIAALAGVTCIDGVLDIRGSTLTDLSGLESLTTVSELHIGPAPALSFAAAGNPALVSLHGLEHLKGVQAVLIEGNPLLTDLSALSGLTFVTGKLEVVNNDALTSLEGLHGIGRAGEVKVSGNAALTSLSGLRGLTAVDGFTLSQNALLKNFEGMGALMYFGANGLYVGDNASLVDFSGLKIGYIGADFNVTSNAALTSLKGLETVTLLAWTVSIRDNPLLASIRELSAVTEVRGEVTVSGNPLLPTCQVNALLAPLGKTCACTGNNDAGTCQ